LEHPALAAICGGTTVLRTLPNLLTVPLMAICGSIPRLQTPGESFRVIVLVRAQAAAALTKDLPEGAALRFLRFGFQKFQAIAMV
jgi:hypothetical protein